MRDSDWSRPNLLRSDWLLPHVAIMTTDSPQYLITFHAPQNEIRLHRETKKKKWNTAFLQSSFFDASAKKDSFNSDLPHGNLL